MFSRKNPCFFQKQISISRNFFLQFTYGVNAWRHWVVGKNAELEKQRAQGKYMKPFETDILKLRADELNYTLCMFVKEVRKPNGDPYASDSILYLTLGIQEYLFENGRIDNIFTDMYYEPFTSANHEVIKDFKLPINELGYFVTRIEGINDFFLCIVFMKKNFFCSKQAVGQKI